MKQRFYFEAIAEQIEKRDISLGDLFQFNVEKIRCHIDLIGHVQVIFFFFFFRFLDNSQSES